MAGEVTVTIWWTQHRPWSETFYPRETGQKVSSCLKLLSASHPVVLPRITRMPRMIQSSWHATRPRLAAKSIKTVLATKRHKKHKIEPVLLEDSRASLCSFPENLARRGDYSNADGPQKRHKRRKIRSPNFHALCASLRLATAPDSTHHQRGAAKMSGSPSAEYTMSVFQVRFASFA